MPQRLLLTSIALLLLALAAACGRRETGAPPRLAETPTAAGEAPTFTPLTGEELLRATEQALSLMLTASPGSAEGYTAIALFETARTTLTAGAIPPEQRRPTSTLDPAQPTPTETPQGSVPPTADAQATAIASMQRTSEVATAARAIDYTATAFSDEQQTSVVATAAMAATMGLPSATPMATEAPKGALRFYLPTDAEQLYSIYGFYAGEQGYSVDLMSRDTSQRLPPTVALHAGTQAEIFWPRPRPEMPDPEQVTPQRIRGAEGLSAIVYTALTLAWVEDGQPYMLVSTDYSLQELLAFAESLEPHGRDEWELRTARLQRTQ